MARDERIAELEEKARRIRAHVVRIAGMSDCHTGGSLSIADMLAGLYFHTLRVDPGLPGWEGRDYFILSKGHCVPALDAALAMRGFFPEDALTTHLQLDSIISGHACARVTPGIDVSTGSLGHGLSIGVGLALGVRMDGAANRVFVMIGDGELQEGSNWEAAMAGAHHKLEGLVAIVDRNMYQTGPTEEMMALEPLADKWRAFGWATRVIDGHDMAQIVETLDALPFEKGRPSAIVSRTEKGHGVSMSIHQHMNRFDEAQTATMLAELGQGGGEGGRN
ncbi:MAG: transketolase [Planctomycetota bacterium]|nr:transketolase [Planctomycetota bacterium]